MSFVYCALKFKPVMFCLKTNQTVLEEPCSVLHVLICLHTHVYMYMFTYVRVTDTHSCMPCDANSGFHLRVYFRVAISVSSAGYGWEGHQYQLVKFCSSRPKYFVPTLRCYALRTCSPYASICNGIKFVRCDGNSKQFPWISPLSAKEENRVRSFCKWSRRFALFDFKFEMVYVVLPPLRRMRARCEGCHTCMCLYTWRVLCIFTSRCLLPHYAL